MPKLLDLKLYKTIKTESENSNSEVKIYSNLEWLEIEYKTPEWNLREDLPEDEQELEPCFQFKNNTYFLSEFMKFYNQSGYLKEFHGYKGESYFSSVLIKIHESGDSVQAFYLTS